MELDVTTKEILINIQRAYASRGMDYSIEELANIVESQFIVATLAFKKGLEVRLPKFGSFQRNHTYQLSISVKEVNAIKHTLTKEEYDSRILDIKMNNKAIIKQRAKERKKPTTLEDLINTPDLVNTVNKYDKSL